MTSSNSSQQGPEKPQGDKTFLEKGIQHPSAKDEIGKEGSEDFGIGTTPLPTTPQAENLWWVPLVRAGTSGSITPAQAAKKGPAGFFPGKLRLEMHGKGSPGRCS